MTAAAFDLLLTTCISRRCASDRLRRDSRRRARHRRRARSHGSGAARDLPRDVQARRSAVAAADAGRRPGSIDCHTHLVYAGNRADEFERRLQRRDATPTSRARAAASLPRCARRAPRATTSSRAQSAPRLAALAAEGVTTVEIKSGYGLDTANELKQLRVARALGVRAAASTCARRCSPRTRCRRNSPDAPTTTSTRLRRDDSRRSRARAWPTPSTRSARRSASRRRRRGACSRPRARTDLPVKLHADQLSRHATARALAAEFGALSADHLEYTNDAGIAAMARAGTVAVLLPGAFYALRETRLPPIAALRAARRADGDLRPTAIRARRPRRRSADAQHGVHAVPAHAGGSAGGRHAARGARARPRRSRHARRRAARRHRAVGHRRAGRARVPDRRQSPARASCAAGTRSRAGAPDAALEARTAATRRSSIDVPHAGTHVPDAIRAAPDRRGARALPDTDWHVEKLYAFARDGRRDAARGDAFALRRRPQSRSVGRGALLRAPTTPSCVRRARSRTSRSTRDGRRARRATRSTQRRRDVLRPVSRAARRARSSACARATAMRSCSTAIRSAARCRAFSPAGCRISISAPRTARAARPTLQALARRRAGAAPRVLARRQRALQGRLRSRATTACRTRASTRCSSRWRRRCYMDEAPPYRCDAARAAALVAVLERLVVALVRVAARPAARR